MLSREDITKIIDAAYAAGVSGDKEALAQHWAEGARFRLAADPNSLGDIAIEKGGAMEMISGLIDRFVIHDIQRLDTLIEDNKVVIRSAALISYGNGSPVRTEIMDLLHLDDDGRIQSVIHFTDTAQMKGLLDAV